MGSKRLYSEIAEETRNFKNITLGVSPRGCIVFMKASQAYAALKGRDFATLMM